MPRQPLTLNLPDANQLPVYASDSSIERTKLRILSYEKNPRNLEAPVYSLSDKILTELIRPCRGAIDNWPQPVIYYRTDKLTAETARLYEDLEKKQPAPDQSKIQTRSMKRLEGLALELAQGVAQQQQNVREDKKPRLIIIRSSRRSNVVASRMPVGTPLKDDVQEAIGAADAEDAEDDDDIPDDVSVLSTFTTAERDRFEIIPDFVLICPIYFDMPEPRVMPGPAPTGRAAEKEAAALDIARRYVAACHLYGEQFLIHDAIGLVQEDKRNPTRVALFPDAAPEVLEDALRDRLEEAEGNLCLYLFLIFLLEKKTQRLVARSVSGIFWRWAEFKRDEIPLYYVPGDHVTMAHRLPSEREKNAMYKQWWAQQPVYEVGTLESDMALTQMREKVIINLKEFCPKWREGKTPVWD